MNEISVQVSDIKLTKVNMSVIDGQIPGERYSISWYERTRFEKDGEVTIIPWRNFGAVKYTASMSYRIAKMERMDIVAWLLDSDNGRLGGEDNSQVTRENLLRMVEDFNIEMEDVTDQWRLTTE